jgi:hypothetical protein
MTGDDVVAKCSPSNSNRTRRGLCDFEALDKRLNALRRFGESLPEAMDTSSVFLRLGVGGLGSGEAGVYDDDVDNRISGF